MPTTPAELCGRIFSVIEATQDAALGELNRGVSAMYAATSTNPSLVLPRLINRRMAHHRKLLRDKGGLAVTLDSRLAELFHQVNEMGGVPGALSSVGQSQFALGYFAERRDRFTKRTGEPPSDTQEEMQ